MTNNSYELSCSQRGHNNNKVLNQIHNYIKYLIKIGVFPEGCYLGRITVGRFTRAGLLVSLEYLEDNKDAILAALEDRFPNVDPEQIYRILQQGVILAAYNGLLTLPNEACHRFAKLINTMPKAVQCMVMGRPEHRATVVKRIASQNKSTEV